MGRSRYKIYEEHYPYFITSTFNEQLSLFADQEVAKIVLDSLQFLQKERLITLYAYVFMHDHLHCIMEGNNLSDKLRTFKSYTARAIIDYLKETNRTYYLRRLKNGVSKENSEYKVWQEGFHPKQIRTTEMMIQKISYIHYNPVKAGFVNREIDWRYSSACNYEGLDGLIPICVFNR
jgi:REP element-mobilizing transposase RayT